MFVGVCCYYRLSMLFVACCVVVVRDLSLVVLCLALVGGYGAVRSCFCFCCFACRVLALLCLCFVVGCALLCVVCFCWCCSLIVTCLLFDVVRC